MDYEAFLNRVVDDGISAASANYAKRPDKKKGAIAGFEACRGKSPSSLAILLADSRRATRVAQEEKAENYWEIRCFEVEVEWTCNVVSAALGEGGTQIVTVTARGMAKAANILGVWQDTVST